MRWRSMPTHSRLDVMKNTPAYISATRCLSLWIKPPISSASSSWTSHPSACHMA